MSKILIDGDTLIYRSLPSDVQCSFKKKLNIDNTKEEALYNFWGLVNKIITSTIEDDLEIWFSPSRTFRNDINPNYKIHRAVTDQQIQIKKLVSNIKETLIKFDRINYADNMEADDMLAIRMTEESDAYMVGEDKDFLTVPGKHLFWLRHGETLKALKDRNYERLDEDFDFIDVSQEEAIFFEYCQFLAGDTTDNIKGVPKIGMVKARKFLESMSELTLQEKVVSKYIEAFGDDWYDQLSLNVKMVHLLRSRDDFEQPDNWEIVKELRR